MVGRVLSGGTGLPKIMIDTDLIQNSEYIEDLELINRGDFIKLEYNEIFEDIMSKRLKESSCLINLLKKLIIIIFITNKI